MLTSTGPQHRADTNPTEGDSLRSAMPAGAAIEACDALARAGSLPGFQRTSPTSGTARVLGQPFDRDLIVDAADAAHTPGGSVIHLHTRLRRKTPILFVVVALFTVWPGVWLTDSLIQTYFTSAQNWIVQTWMWYLPLAVLPLPFAARSMWRKSQAAAAEHYAEVRERIAKAVGASMDASANDTRTNTAAPGSPRAQPLSASA